MSHNAQRAFSATRPRRNCDAPLRAMVGSSPRSRRASFLQELTDLRELISNRQRHRSGHASFRGTHRLTVSGSTACHARLVVANLIKHDHITRSRSRHRQRAAAPSAGGVLAEAGWTPKAAHHRYGLSVCATNRLQSPDFFRLHRHLPMFDCVSASQIASASWHRSYA